VTELESMAYLESVGYPPALIRACEKPAEGELFVCGLRNGERLAFAGARPLTDMWVELQSAETADTGAYSSLHVVALEVHLQEIAWVARASGGRS
jgi:hypothetical protein